jgi:glycosyltransferase involved in cell wall biosynthesis
MRVAINCAIATRGISGTSRGLSHLLTALGEIPDTEVHQTWPSHGPRSSRVWNAGAQASWDLCLAARESQSADVLISPCNVGRARRGQRHVLVLHDTMVLDRPDLFDRGYALYARALFGHSVRHADVILVPSHYTKKCLETRWTDTPPVMVAAWPLQAKQPRLERPTDAKLVLMVGATEPHKRQATGIAAVKLAREASGEDLRLTIVGPRGHAEEEIAAAMRAADPDRGWISRAVNVPGAELEKLYESAWLLLQPSLMEGYGLPVGEAAIRGVPVLHSGQGALNETAPKAVASPEEPAGYASEICLLLDDARYSDAAAVSLIAAGAHTQARFAQHVAEAIAFPDAGPIPCT